MADISVLVEEVVRASLFRKKKLTDEQMNVSIKELGGHTIDVIEIQHTLEEGFGFRMIETFNADDRPSDIVRCIESMLESLD